MTHTEDLKLSVTWQQSFTMAALISKLALIYLVGYSITGIVHFIGLLLLYKSKTNLKNQRLLIMNLACIEMLLCLSMSTLLSSKWTKVMDRNIASHVNAFLNTFFFTEMRVAMIHIIFDRFFYIYTNIKYPVYMTRYKMLLIVAMHWSISLLCAIVGFSLYVVGAFSGHLQFTFFLSLALDITILISSIITYVYFYKMVQKIKEQEASVPVKARPSKIALLTSKFKIPCLIVLTYILFNLTSIIMLTISKYVQYGRKFHLLEAFSHVPIIIGIISDACIYVFGNSNVRKLLCSLSKKTRSAVGFTN